MKKLLFLLLIPVILAGCGKKIETADQDSNSRIDNLEKYLGVYEEKSWDQDCMESRNWCEKKVSQEGEKAKTFTVDIGKRGTDSFQGVVDCKYLLSDIKICAETIIKKYW